MTTKHGLLGLSKNAALECAAQGIRVVTGGPGFISTPLVESSLDACCAVILRQACLPS